MFTVVCGRCSESQLPSAYVGQLIICIDNNMDLPCLPPCIRQFIRTSTSVHVQPTASPPSQASACQSRSGSACPLLKRTCWNTTTCATWCDTKRDAKLLHVLSDGTTRRYVTRCGPPRFIRAVLQYRTVLFLIAAGHWCDIRYCDSCSNCYRRQDLHR